ncbi:hypothetical protein HNP89_001479 [Methanococcus maripaludis]|uniref:Apea-like HEPN domain-containing protein n=1 Tax=Methanococcus maripaludis TaxID=39152 RepID=A0A7J9P2A2_METMI|nr:HEPN domain-containing protein [Methanococcus maripaludis]MBA2853503.1 hypothetical protein [Methanococcus maripaludis]
MHKKYPDNISIEYLIVISEKDNFCDNINSFNNLLKTNSQVKIKKNTYEFKNLSVNYNVELNPTENIKQRVFNVLFKCDDINRADDFSALIYSFEELLDNLDKNNIQYGKIWDELSLHYSMLAYPEINHVENLMRKLITKFMMKFGTEWTEKNVPDGVIKSLDKNGQKPFGIFSLYDVDFIRLDDFIFKKYIIYSKKELEILIKSIDTAKDIEEISLEMLKEAYVPKSNWDRFLSEPMDCDQKEIRKLWRELYGLRCKVAHNNTVKKEKYDTIIKLVNKLKTILNKALDEVGNITIPPEIKESVIENTVRDVKDPLITASNMIDWGLENNATIQDILDLHAGAVATAQTIREWCFENNAATQAILDWDDGINAAAEAYREFYEQELKLKEEALAEMREQELKLKEEALAEMREQELKLKEEALAEMHEQEDSSNPKSKKTSKK